MKISQKMLSRGGAWAVKREGGMAGSHSDSEMPLPVRMWVCTWACRWDQKAEESVAQRHKTQNELGCRFGSVIEHLLHEALGLVPSTIKKFF
jgi:hypothetical protein